MSGFPACPMEERWPTGSIPRSINHVKTTAAFPVTNALSMK